MSRLLALRISSSPIFPRSVCLGAYPEELVEILSEHDLLPDYTVEELEFIRENTVDFLGG